MKLIKPLKCCALRITSNLISRNCSASANANANAVQWRAISNVLMPRAAWRCTSAANASIATGGGFNHQSMSVYIVRALVTTGVTTITTTVASAARRGRTVSPALNKNNTGAAERGGGGRARGRAGDLLLLY